MGGGLFLKFLYLMYIVINMKRRRIPRYFFERSAVEVSRSILGKYLVASDRSGKIKEGRVVEVEAYVGPHDRASHAYKGKITPRNKAEFLRGGYVYIYLVYGMYWQLNIVTGKKDHPECFLIRAVETEGRAGEASGPGKLCRYFGFDKDFYGEDVGKSPKIWFEDRNEKIFPKNIACSRRVGIDYAGRFWALRKLRFYLKGSSVITKLNKSKF